MQVLKAILLGMITFVLSTDVLAASGILRKEILTQKAMSTNSIFETLSQEGILHLTLKTEIDSLLVKKRVAVYQFGTIRFKDEAGEAAILPIKIKVRGKSRRTHCSFPPLKLKFDKEGLRALDLNTDYNKLKLVTHCNGGYEAQQTVLKEYLIYKMYNALTPNSFRVQLVKIKYVDTNKSKRTIKRYGFLIENTSEMTTRIGREEVKTYNLTSDQLELDNFNLMAAFQYTIGNSDWRINSLRNVKLVNSSHNEIVVIPYDFDFSGLVKANYALPDADFGLKKVEDRIFFGELPSKEHALALLDHLERKKTDFYQIIKQAKGLNTDNKLKMKAYLNDFYMAIETENFIQEAFINKQPMFFNENMPLTTRTVLR